MSLSKAQSVAHTNFLSKLTRIFSVGYTYQLKNKSDSVVFKKLQTIAQSGHPGSVP
jgi:hypothetical protein